VPAAPAWGRVTARVHSVSRRMSLRSRLLLGLIAVAALALVTTDIVVYHEVDSFLTAQVDDQLITTMNPFLHQIDNSFNGGGFGNYNPGNLAFRQDTPAGAWGALVYGKGVIDQGTATFSVQEAGAPLIPTDAVSATLASPTSVTVTSNGVSSETHALEITVAARGDASFHYRLLLVSFGGSSAAAVVVVALPLTSVDAALHHLVGIDLLASAAVLAFLAALGYVVVRVGMRPLAEIELTAEQIAAGDLTQRVARAESQTEVGRLGAALNAMLGQIEHAFSEQQASEDRLRQFLADASHELRTPVTSIRGYAELFRLGAVSKPEDVALALRRIEDESIRMGVLVDDLLLLARLDEGRPLELAPVDLVEIATNVAADAQVVSPDHPVTLDADGAVTVVGDPQQLVQVATNLVQNAIRYTPPGTPVTVGVRRSETLAILSVRDEGPGMSTEHAARVFERFYRADPSRTRGSGGTGLGLSIVKSIAEAHGGRAFVVTSPGQGATFVIELPIEPNAGTTSGVDPHEVRGVVERPQYPVVAPDHERGDRSVVDGDERERTSAGRPGDQ